MPELISISIIYAGVVESKFENKDLILPITSLSADSLE